MHFIFYYNIN